ncbi:helix-turn-helix domain-containing protein [Paenibacillus filicis]|uniref:Helix-turn-helix domain-containing protein n=1 Tax=Paenibacillus filicis TaxID=669464 RepID=A0ABU9DT47_9BACL
MKKQLMPLEKLIEARREMKLTQDDVAKLSGISRSMYCNIERGEVTPSLRSAYSISRVLKKSIEQLFFARNARITNKKLA